MRLRPMLMSDADFMLELKNYPETMANSIVTKTPVSKEKHYIWLETYLKYFQVIYSDEHTYGAVRINGNEISIWIDRKYWGKGIATFIINMVSEKGMIAKIAEENIPSMRAFINAGFKPVAYDKVLGFYTYKK